MKLPLALTLAAAAAAAVLSMPAAEAKKTKTKRVGGGGGGLRKSRKLQSRAIICAAQGGVAASGQVPTAASYSACYLNGCPKANACTTSSQCAPGACCMPTNIQGSYCVEVEPLYGLNKYIAPKCLCRQGSVTDASAGDAVIDNGQVTVVGGGGNGGGNGGGGSGGGNNNNNNNQQQQQQQQAVDIVWQDPGPEQLQERPQAPPPQVPSLQVPHLQQHLHLQQQQQQQKWITIR
mmetsp:Transcript_30858/g.90187  ORF Transcript_30858/g.90187 Transcript_30858/m.90187 type:complete len:234 (+) Transcript_30858:227-928(+)